MIGRYRREVREVDGQMRSVIVSPLPRCFRVVHPELGAVERADSQGVIEFAEGIEWVSDDNETVRLIRDGRYFWPGSEALDDGETPMEPKVAEKVRALLLGVGSDLAANTVDGGLEPDWLIDRIWRRNTLLQLNGNSKAGKTEAVCMEIIRTLVVPGHKFFGRFAAGAVDRDRWRGVVFINTETDAHVIEALLPPLHSIWVNIGNGEMVTARSLVTVFNLREAENGGPLAANLFDATTFERWRTRLGDCVECLGDDDWGPLAVIFDNGTAVLRALQRDVQAHIGELQEVFRTLLEVIDTRSGIFVTHSTQNGSNALGGSISDAGSDGEMRYFTEGPSPSPKAARYFAYSPRTGAEGVERTRVVKTEGGFVFAGLVAPAENRPEEPASESDDQRAESQVLALFEKAGGRELTGTESTDGGGVEGARLRRARDRLHERGLLAVRREGRQGQMWSMKPVDGGLPVS